jgi:hypothetical protein
LLYWVASPFLRQPQQPLNILLLLAVAAVLVVIRQVVVVLAV